MDIRLGGTVLELLKKLEVPVRPSWTIEKQATAPKPNGALPEGTLVDNALNKMEQERVEVYNDEWRKLSS